MVTALDNAASGYRIRPRYAWITMPGDFWDEKERSLPLSVLVPANLTFEQLDAIPYGDGVAYEEIERALAPYVTRWNVTAVNLDTGQREPVPPPAEAGPDALKVLSAVELEWLAIRMKTAGIDPLPME